MKRWNLFIFATALILGAAGIVSAATTSTSTKSQPTAKRATTAKARTAVHHEWGTISSVSKADLVLSHEYKGKKEETTFTLNSSTKKDGSMEKGARATVYYMMDNNEKLATLVKAYQPKTQKKATAVSKKS